MLNSQPENAQPEKSRPSPASGGRELLRAVLKRERRSLLALGAWSALSVLPVALSGQLIAAAMDGGFLAGNGLFGVLTLGGYALAMLVGAFANRQVFSPLSIIVEQLRDDLVHRIVRSGVLRAVGDDRPPETGVMSRIISQTETVRNNLGGLLFSFTQVGFTVVAAVLGLFTLVPLVGAILVAVALVMGFALVTISRAWKRRYEASLLSEEDLGDRVGRVLNGLRDVTASNAENRTGDDLDRAVRTHARALAKVANLSGARVGVIGVTARVPLMTLLLLAPWLLSSGSLSVGALTGAATYLITGLEPALRALVQQIGNIGLEMMTVLNRLADYTRAPELPTGGTIALDRQTASLPVSLRGVTFRYSTHSEPLLDRADLDIPHGEHLAIVGPSGIGKSTAAGVLAGLEKPEAGTVLLGGVDIERLRHDWLRETIALVPQQAYVFAGTVRENLVYLAPWSREDHLDRVVAALGLEELVERLGGYDGVIEQPDTSLTAGERQLVTLARVHVSAARITILDEATCHLDAATEQRVERALARRPGTLIVIAHRMSSALRADRVLMIDQQGLHLGTHGQLVRDVPSYADLVGHWHGFAQGTDARVTA